MLLSVSEFILILLDLRPIPLRRKHELAIVGSMKECDKAGSMNDREVANWFQLLLWEMNCCLSEWEVLPRDLTGGISQEPEEGKEANRKEQVPFPLPAP